MLKVVFITIRYDLSYKPQVTVQTHHSASPIMIIVLWSANVKSADIAKIYVSLHIINSIHANSLARSPEQLKLNLK